MNFDALSLQFKTAKPLILLRAKSAPFTLSFLYKVFKEPIEKPLSISSRWLALYLVAPLSTLVGGLWMVNGWRINRIGKYLQDIIAVKINIILNSFVSINGLQPKIQTLEWESPNQRLKYKWQRRSIDWFIYLMTFVFSGFLSQILLLKDKTGSIITQISQLEFPVIYITNTIMLLFAFTGFMAYLFKGFQYKIKSQIHFPNKSVAKSAFRRLGLTKSDFFKDACKNISL